LGDAQTLLLAAALGFVTATILTPVVARTAVVRGWLDHPDGRRKRHVAPVPTVGGIAVVLAFGIALAAIVAVRPDAGSQGVGDLLLPLFLATVALCAIGFVDDVRRLHPLTRLALQAGCALFLYASGFRIESLSNPLGGKVALGPLALPITLLWLVGMSNAFNLIDGLDGLAAGLGLVSTVALLVASLQRGNWEIAIVAGGLAGALLGFLPYNFNPARVFLGSCGSLPAGFVLAAVAVAHSVKGTVALAVAVPLLALALPILDVMLAVTRRFVRRRPVFQGDRDHIHHRLIDLGLTPRRAVVTLYAVATLFSALALAIAAGPSFVMWSGAVVILLVVGLGVRALGYWEVTEFQKSFLSRIAPAAPAPAATAILWELGHDLRRAPSFDVAWDCACQAAWTLGFAELHFLPQPPLAARCPERRAQADRTAAAAHAQASWSIPVEVEGNVVAELVARRAPEPTDFDVMAFLALVRDAVCRDATVLARPAGPRAVPPRAAAR
jgi:UDP-GlcNAc:undecaprenyl-phosphate GlcNAc-1-phosphate transferase